MSVASNAQAARLFDQAQDARRQVAILQAELTDLQDALHFARLAMASALRELEDAGRSNTHAARELRLHCSKLEALDPYVADPDDAFATSPAPTAWDSIIAGSPTVPVAV